jgi:hypothetical protein
VTTRNYSDTIRALRTKAADRAIGPAEARVLRAKADELEAKYGNASSPPTDNTTVTGPTPDEAWEELNRLFKNQWQWNDKYYDRHGNSRYTEADQDDLYEETYKYEEHDYDAIEEDY